MTLENILEACKGKLLSPCPVPPGKLSLRAVSTDTRALRPGDCFVALEGERFDGHDFIARAVEEGASAIVAREGRAPAPFSEGVCFVEVADTLRALGEVARYHRRRHRIPLVGITGSNGKTSTKEMLASILGLDRQVLKNRGNFNNLVGVPLTLLELEDRHGAAVVEMGINMPGEMERLVEIAEPSVGLVTNIHPAHLERLGSPRGVLREKGRLWTFLEKRWTEGRFEGEAPLAVVNGDDPLLTEFAGSLSLPRIVYSVSDAAARARLAGGPSCVEGRTVFQMDLDGARVEVNWALAGMHHVRNGLAAAAAALGMGESPETVARGLSVCRPVSQRMEVHRLENGSRLVDDTYNANPASVEAAVTALCENDGSRGGRTAVLADMKELGDQAVALHRRVGRTVRRLGVDRLITLGELGREIGLGALEAGMETGDWLHADSHEDIVEALDREWAPGSRVLVKGSRTMAMERVVRGLLAKRPTEGES